MQEILLVIFTLLAILFAVLAILKKFNSRFAFVGLGLIFLFIATIIKNESVLGADTTGNMFLDIFDLMRIKLKSTTSGIGATIMTGGAYVLFMNHIKASNVLAEGTSKVLYKLRKPYVILAGVFFIGSILKIFITSQVALGLLLMVTMYPVLVELGVSRLSCVSTMVMCGMIDEGVNDSSAIFASGVMKLTPMQYFVQYEGIIGMITIIALTIFIPIYSKYKDKKEFGEKSEKVQIEKEIIDLPKIYGILPIVPLVLIVVFSFIPSIKMDVITANMIGFTITFIFELIRRRHEVSKVSNLINEVGLFMADYFNKIVAMIIAANIFSEAVKQLGGINILAEKMASFQGAGIMVTICLCIIVFLTGALTGSGNAPFYAFGPLVPELSKMLNVSPQSMLIPMHLVGGTGRTLSPFCASVIAIPAIANVEISDCIKRSVAPIIVATILVTVLPMVFWMF